MISYISFLDIICIHYYSKILIKMNLPLVLFLKTIVMKISPNITHSICCFILFCFVNLHILNFSLTFDSNFSFLSSIRCPSDYFSHSSKSFTGSEYSSESPLFFYL